MDFETNVVHRYYVLVYSMASTVFRTPFTSLYCKEILNEPLGSLKRLSGLPLLGRYQAPPSLVSGMTFPNSLFQGLSNFGCACLV